MSTFNTSAEPFLRKFLAGQSRNVAFCHELTAFLGPLSNVSSDDQLSLLSL